MHAITMTREDIRRTAETLGWDLATTMGYHRGDVREEAQDAASLIESAHPEAGLVFGFLAHGSNVLPWREAVIGARLTSDSIRAHLVDIRELSTRPEVTGEDAFVDYVEVILRHFNAVAVD